MTTASILSFLATALTAGLLGAGAMELTMWLITRSGWAKGNMIVALGSLLTKSRENAHHVGAVVHGMSAVVFSVCYTLLMFAVGLTALPAALMLGLGVGFLHGMLVSLMLVWVVAERHPLEEFKEADLAIGLSHLAGHVAFGGMVGLIVGISPL